MSRYVKSKHDSGTFLLSRPQVCGGIVVWIRLHHLGTHLFTPTMKFAGKFFGLLRLDLSQILVLSNVLREIEELNGSILEIFQQFIFPVPNRTTGTLHSMITVMWKMPVNRTTVHFLTSD